MITETEPGQRALDCIDAIRMVLAGSEYDGKRIKAIQRIIDWSAPGADVNGTQSVEIFIHAVREADDE